MANARGQTGAAPEGVRCQVEVCGVKKWELRRFALGLLFAVSIGLAGLSAPSQAAPIITWELPSERADGSPLDIGELDATRIVCNGESVALVAAPVLSFDASVLPSGIYECTARAIDLAGLESVDSNSVSLAVGIDAPGQPAEFRVTVADLPPVGGSAMVSLVQSRAADIGGGATGSLAFTSDVGAGNTGIIVIAYFPGSSGNQVTGVTDSGSVSWDPIYDSGLLDPVFHRLARYYIYKRPELPSGALTVTVAQDGVSWGTSVLLAELDADVSVTDSATDETTAFQANVFAEVTADDPDSFQVGAISISNTPTSVSGYNGETVEQTSTEFGHAVALGFKEVESAGADDFGFIIDPGTGRRISFFTAVLEAESADPGPEVESADLDVEPLDLSAAAGVERTVSGALGVQASTISGSASVQASAEALLGVRPVTLDSFASAVRSLLAVTTVAPLELSAVTSVETQAAVELSVTPATLAALASREVQSSGALDVEASALSANVGAESSASVTLSVTAPGLLSDVALARTAAVALDTQAATLSGNADSSRSASAVLGVRSAALSADLGADKTVAGAVVAPAAEVAADAQRDTLTAAALDIPAAELQAQVSVVRLASGELALLVPVLSSVVVKDELIASAALTTSVPVVEADAIVSRIASGELLLPAVEMESGIARAATADAALILTAPSVEAQLEIARLASGDLTLDELVASGSVVLGAIQSVIGLRATPRRIGFTSAGVRDLSLRGNLKRGG